MVKRWGWRQENAAIHTFQKMNTGVWINDIVEIVEQEGVRIWILLGIFGEIFSAHVFDDGKQYSSLEEYTL